ncbi:hypothetical protein JCM3766R1_003384 [Sporobolomyces carnicolor]
MSTPPSIPLPHSSVEAPRTTWQPSSNLSEDSSHPLVAPPGSSGAEPGAFASTGQELRQASVAQLPQARWRGVPVPSTPTRSRVVGPQALVNELAKFDSGTPYEELRFVMELTAAQASENLYPISSASSVCSPVRRSRRDYEKSEHDWSFMSESDATFPQALDAMDPKLSPAARRYLDEYNSGQHRLPPVFSPALFSPVRPSASFFNSPPPPPLEMLPPLPHLIDPVPPSLAAGPNFPFGPAQPSHSYFPGPVVTPIPCALPASPPVVPTFDFQLAPSPSAFAPDHSFANSSSNSLSPSALSFDASSPSSASSSFSSTSCLANGYGFTPSTTPSTSPHPDPSCSSYLSPLAAPPLAFFPSSTALPSPSLSSTSSSSSTSSRDTSDTLALVRRRKKSLVRLCAEEHARTKGAVRSWGIVKFFDGNKGWGFILDQSRVPGEDVWTHYTNLEIPRGHRFLVSEEVVEYLIVWDSKKSQLKALLVTGLGGTPLLAFSDPTLAASLTKFKPSQGPLPPTLSPETKQKIYAAKREKQRKFDEAVKQERIKRLVAKEVAIVATTATTATSGAAQGGGGANDRDGGADVDVDESEDREDGMVEIQRGLLNFGVIGLSPSNDSATGRLIGLGLSGIEEEVEDEVESIGLGDTTENESSGEDERAVRA